jgi:hypothetical protein
MIKFPKIVTLLLLLATTLWISCNKDSNSQTANNEFANFTPYTGAEQLFDSAERGLCGTIAASVEYEGKVEYEFDVAFSGWGALHFFNQKSGTILPCGYLPPAVQTREINIVNVPKLKQNPKCPWISANSIVKIKIFYAQKNSSGKWEQVPGSSDVINYTLGDKAPTRVLLGGTRVYCLDKPVGNWKICTLTETK